MNRYRICRYCWEREGNADRLRRKRLLRPTIFHSVNSDGTYVLLSKVIAASPDLFPEFCSLGATSSLLQLLAHPNTDIAIDVLRLLAEMCDPSAVLIEDDMDGSAGEMENVALLVQDVVSFMLY